MFAFGFTATGAAPVITLTPQTIASLGAGATLTIFQLPTSLVTDPRQPKLVTEAEMAEVVKQVLARMRSGPLRLSLDEDEILL
jgi:hypothetical protein